MIIDLQKSGFAFRLCITAGLSFCAGYFISMWREVAILQLIGGLWSAMSGVIVLRYNAVETPRATVDRLIGTLIGCIISAAYLYITDFIWLFPIAVFLTALICLSIKELESTMVTACLATIIVITISKVDQAAQPWLFSLSRFIESACGVVIAFIVFHMHLHISNTKNR